MLHLSNVPLWAAIVVSLGAGIIAAAVCYFLVNPRIRKYIASEYLVRHILNVGSVFSEGKEARESPTSSVVISVTGDPELDKVAIRSESTTTNASNSCDSLQTPSPSEPQGSKDIEIILSVTGDVLYIRPSLLYFRNSKILQMALPG